MLNSEQCAQWREQGFLVLPGFKPQAEIEALVQRTHALVEASTPTPFSPAVMMASAETMHAFYEDEAFDGAGRLRQSQARSINKLGHAMHDLDPVFDRFSRDARLAAITAELGVREPLLWQSMVIFKQPSIGGEVRWHQDATYFVTEPQSVLALWFALEDATLANGCLWVEPGGHRGPLRERFVRAAPGSSETSLEVLDRTPWPGQERAVPLEVAAGALVVFDGLLPHYSAPNRSPQSRLAYTLHLTSGAASYSPLNWLQRSAALPVRGFD